MITITVTKGAITYTFPSQYKVPFTDVGPPSDSSSNPWTKTPNTNPDFRGDLPLTTSKTDPDFRECTQTPGKLPAAWDTDEGMPSWTEEEILWTEDWIGD